MNYQLLPHASALFRYTHCEGSWRLEQEARQTKQVAHEHSPEAEAGTRIHAFLAGSAESILSPNELAIATQLYNHLEDARAQTIGDAAQADSEHLEERLYLRDSEDRAIFSGQPDRFEIYDELALLVDYKSGYATQEQIGLFQLSALAILIAQNFPQVSHVVALLINENGIALKVYYTQEELFELKERLLKLLGRINAEHASLVPAPDTCRFCPASLICPALRRASSEIEPLSIAKLPLESREAANLLTKALIVERLVDEIKKFYLQRLIENPGSIEGYEAKLGAKVREVSDWPAAFEKLGLPIGDFLDSATWKITEVEAKTKLSKQQFANALGDLLTYKQNRPSLARVTK